MKPWEENMRVYEEIEVISLTKGEKHQETRYIAKEHTLVLLLPGEEKITLSCSPKDLEALALGHVISQGLVEDWKDINPAFLERESQNETWVKIRYREKKKDEEHKRVEEISPKEFQWKKEWIFALATAFKQGTDFYNKTHSAHNVMLMHQGEILFLCEDIGRHNALDKAIGKALLSNIPLKESIVFLSGRLPKDMMEKIIRAGFPLVATNAVPTAEGVALAKAGHVTLIAKAREKSMEVYHLGGGDCVDW